MRSILSASHQPPLLHRSGSSSRSKHSSRGGGSSGTVVGHHANNRNGREREQEATMRRPRRQQQPAPSERQPSQPPNNSNNNNNKVLEETTTTTTRAADTTSTAAAARRRTSSMTTTTMMIQKAAANDVECDFYRNPTLLSRLILHQKYKSALRRLRNHPEEAKIWVCRKRPLTTTDTEQKQRQLRSSGQCTKNGYHESVLDNNEISKRESSSNNDNEDDSDNDDDLKECSRHTCSDSSVYTSSSSDDCDDDDDENDDDEGNNQTTRANKEKVTKDYDEDSKVNDESSSDVSTTAFYYSLRQLPIHTCSESLGRVADPVLRADLEELIGHLVVLYGDGCTKRDHRGRLPIHLIAGCGCCRSETVSLMLMAAPCTAHERDRQGRTTLELHRAAATTNNDNENNDNDNEEEVRGLLSRGIQFWEIARGEVHYRMKHRIPHGSNDSVRSMSVLASSLCDNSTLASNLSSSPTDKKHNVGGVGRPKGAARARGTPSSHHHGGNHHDGMSMAGRTTTTPSWSQLERRSMYLEQALAETFEKNYEMSESILKLKNEKDSILHKYNDLLRDRQNRSHPPPSTGTNAAAAAAAAASATASAALEEANRELQMRVDRLTTQNREYERRLEIFNLVMEGEEENDNDGGTAALLERTSLTSEETVTASSHEAEAEADDGTCTPSFYGNECYDVTDNEEEDYDMNNTATHEEHEDASSETAIINTILTDAEQMNGGQQLSAQIIAAWKTTSVSVRSVVGTMMPVISENDNDNDQEDDCIINGNSEDISEDYYHPPTNQEEEWNYLSSNTAATATLTTNHSRGRNRNTSTSSGIPTSSKTTQLERRDYSSEKQQQQHKQQDYRLGILQQDSSSVDCSKGSSSCSTDILLLDVPSIASGSGSGSKYTTNNTATQVQTTPQERTTSPYTNTYGYDQMLEELYADAIRQEGKQPTSSSSSSSHRNKSFGSKDSSTSTPVVQNHSRRPCEDAAPPNKLYPTTTTASLTGTSSIDDNLDALFAEAAKMYGGGCDSVC